MKIQYVTSFGDDYYEKHGRAMLVSFLEHSDATIKVYYEDTPPDIINNRIEALPLYEIESVVPVLQALQTFPITQGVVAPGGKFNYNCNMFKFARKIFAENHAARHSDADILVWIDSDVVFNKALPDNWIEDKFKDGDFMLYMFRKGFHGCSSFVAWNLKHEQNDLFWANYIEAMLSGRWLLLNQWHDISIKEKLMEVLSLSVYDLAKDIKLSKGPANVFDAVFDGYAVHNKGKMKKNKGPRRYTQLMLEIKNREPETVIEIGTWNGLRALEMSMANPGMTYYGFDLFEEADATTDRVEKNVKAHNSVKEVAERLQASHFKKIQLIKGNTTVSLPAFAESKEAMADLIWLDGGHSVETIRSDLNYALKLVKDGGVILLDDYYVDMPETDIDQWGCNRVLEESGLDYTVLPVSDPVAGGGRTKMVIIEKVAA